ncbi:hypothetical protein [Rahnella perminowiae]|uniref:hypothetical protein n=1 Tax=Rahnella perminowiae TaxID=2816244 RepID=UPI00215BA5F5|nr:hypothetical protein [Rahnella perminowiae]MCR9003112.1 hypothetical protein [Rahnella perminowiae]
MQSSQRADGVCTALMAVRHLRHRIPQDFRTEATISASGSTCPLARKRCRVPDGEISGMMLAQNAPHSPACWLTASHMLKSLIPGSAPN